MKLAEIRARHEVLEGLTTTQSVVQMRERKSQAHKDRGWLLEREAARNLEIEELLGRLDELEVSVKKQRKKKPKPKPKRPY